MTYTAQQLNVMSRREFDFISEIHGGCFLPYCTIEREKYNRQIKQKCYADYPPSAGRHVNPI